MVARAAEYSSFPLDPNPSIQVSRRGGGRPESVSSMSPNVTNRALTEADFPTVSLLHAKVFGPGRFTRTAYRVREGAAPISPFCRVALLGDRLIAAVRFTPITIGGANGGLLLGPARRRSRFRRPRLRQAPDRRGPRGGEGGRREAGRAGRR